MGDGLRERVLAIVSLIAQYFLEDRDLTSEGDLVDELMSSGFESDEIDAAFSWMENQALHSPAQTELLHPMTSYRVFTDEEKRVLDVEARGFLARLRDMGILNNEELRDFVLAHNDSIDTAYVEKLVKIYIEEATREGVNHDVAFVQMCHETDFLKYTGVVHPDQKNFCGLGTVNDDTPGEYFETVEKGIRAHIQHLKAYASKQELKHELVDNRFYFVQRGIAPVVEELTGRWAADPDYDRKIKKLFKRLEANTERQLIRLSI